MEKITTIGLDIAKHVFQVHGINGAGATVSRRKLRRDDVVGFFKALPSCLIGIEACATGHHWARVLRALGHEVRLMPASYVKPYVKRQKNDATDAEAICEAVTRPTMRFVPVKSEEQQSVLMLHRVRELLIRQRTMLVTALRGHLAEFGIVTQQGIAGVGMLIALIEDGDHDLIPSLARSALLPLIGQLREVHEKVSEMDRQIHAWHRSNELSRRLEIPSGVSSGLHRGRVRSLENSLEANHADDSRSNSSTDRYPHRSWRNFRLVGIEQIDMARDSSIAGK